MVEPGVGGKEEKGGNIKNNRQILYTNAKGFSNIITLPRSRLGVI